MRGDALPRGAAPRRHGALRLVHAGAVVLPLALLGLWAWWSWQGAMLRAGEDAQRNAALIREYAQRVVQTQERTLEVVDTLLAEAPSRAGLSARLAALTSGPAAPLSLVVVDEAGLLVAASGPAPVGLSLVDRPYFVPLRDGAPGQLRLERQTLRPNGQDTLVLAKRRAGERFAGLLLATVPVRAFTDFFSTLARDSRAAAALFRADGALLVRMRPDLPPAQLAPDAPAMLAIAGAEDGLFRAVAGSDGQDRLYGFARIEGRPLYVSYGVAVANVRERWMRDMAPIAGLLLLASALGFLLVERSIRAVHAEEDRRHADAAVQEARRVAALHEMLLRELHHRVKNSMATVLALTRLRSAHATPGADRVLEQRVFALAKVHDLLHVDEFRSRLDVAAFLRALCASPAIVPPGRGIAVTVEAEPMEVDVERASPLALIAAELVTNALRHGFPDGRRGRVLVTLAAPGAGEARARLAVRDDGVGLAEGSQPDGRHSGLALVRRLAAQIGGTVETRQAGGLEVTVSFPA